jgi:hypothetical protein
MLNLYHQFIGSVIRGKQLVDSESFSQHSATKGKFGVN